jgi:hypothetical protein
MKKLALYFVLIAFAVGSFSCQKELEPSGTATQKFSGDWWVFILEDDGEGNFIDLFEEGYLLLSTYNTAANVPDKLFVDFNYEFVPVKVIANLNQSENVIIGENLFNYYDEELEVNILSGTVIRNAATTSGGNVSDSIYIEFEYTSDPGYIFKLAGYRRTGFEEDEH